MPDIKAIIQALDEYLTNQGKDSIAPPDANVWLERKRLLDDRTERSGAPLRKLLRADMIPHAYKVGRLWVIPHSQRK